MVRVVETDDWLATRKPVNATVAFVAPNWIVAPPSGKLAEGKLNGVFGAAGRALTVPETVPEVLSAPAALTLAVFAGVVWSAMLNNVGAAAYAVPVMAIDRASREIAIGRDGGRRRRLTRRNMTFPPRLVTRHVNHT